MPDKHKISKARTKKMVKNLALGVKIKNVAQDAGISKATFYNWKVIAQDIRDQVEKGNIKIKKLTTEQLLFIDFLDSVDKAEAEGEIYLAGKMRDFAETDRHAAQFTLERRYGWTKQIDIGKTEPIDGVVFEEDLIDEEEDETEAQIH